jgi:hypothetical protein
MNLYNRDVRAINAAIKENALGNGRPVLATTTDGTTVRIIHARTHKGQLQGMNLATGQWINILETVE